jgi:hypothetical protein
MTNNKGVNLALTDENVRDTKEIEFSIRALSNEWNFPKEFIIEVATYFINTTESNIFLDYVDAYGLHEAWGNYCEFRGIEHESQYNPFIKDEGNEKG